MKKNSFLSAFIIIAISFSQFNLFAQSSVKKSEEKKPNVIFILMDDLGVGDVGVFFQDQRRLANQRNKPFTITPYLDEMAKSGAILDQYCAAPVCAPSRSSILLGQSQGHANVRDNQFDKALENNYTLGTVMQMAGYTSAAIGKWGLQGNNAKKTGEKWPAHPLKRGFGYYFGYIRHSDGHEHFPKEGLYTGKKEVYDGYKEISNELDKCYTGDLWTANAKKYIIDHESGKDKDKPFFMYLAYDTPHAVLELPTQAYPAGFGLNGGLQWTGKAGAMINTASGKPDSWIDPEYVNKTYDDDNSAATPEVAWPDVYKRYATITKRIDNQIHDILVLLKDLKIDDNTLVIFTSDNGPSIESYIKDEPYKANFFESFGQFDGIKRDVLEGGVRMPTIAWWPKHIAPNTQITSPSISYDWMPTFLDAAGNAKPVRADGVSLLPQLLGKPIQEKSQIYIEYFHNGKVPDYEEFDASHRNLKRNQMQMIRLGDTVALRYNIKSVDDDFGIYKINQDPKQVKDLTKTEDLASLQKYLKGRVLQMRMADTSAPRPYDEGLIPADEVKNVSKGWVSYNYQATNKWVATPNLKTASKTVLSSLKLNSLKNNSVLFEGYILVPADGTYQFNMQTSGKAFLRIHDIAVIDEDFGYQGKLKSQQLHLAKGYHQIRLYYKKKDDKEVPSIKLTCNQMGKNAEDVANAVFCVK